MNKTLTSLKKPFLYAVGALLLIFTGMVLSPSENSNQENTEVLPSSNQNTETKKETPAPQENNPAVNTNVDTQKETTNEKGRVVSVADGDTLRVQVNSEEMKVRLIGIDTPELNHPNEPIQCYAEEAKKALEDLVLNKEVVLEKDVSDVDKYDRYLRYIWLDETLVNEYMTKNGYAFSSSYPPDVKFQERISAGEQYARNNSVGLWAANTCDGDVYTDTYKDPDLTTDPDPTFSKQPKQNVEETQAYSPPPEPDTQPTPAPQPERTYSSSSFSCSCSKTCSEMASCDEAYFQLNTCGCGARDGDNDGVPCESICR